MSRFAVFLCGLFVCLCIDVARLPHDLSGQWDCYTIRQRGSAVEITSDNTIWLAVGELHADGSVRVTWLDVHDGRAAIAYYRLDGNRLVGDWGYVTECWRDSTGPLIGNTREHVMVRK